MINKHNFFKILSSAVLGTLTVGNFSSIWMMEKSENWSYPEYFEVDESTGRFKINYYKKYNLNDDQINQAEKIAMMIFKESKNLTSVDHARRLASQIIKNTGNFSILEESIKPVVYEASYKIDSEDFNESELAEKLANKLLYRFWEDKANFKNVI